MEFAAPLSRMERGVFAAVRFTALPVLGTGKGRRPLPKSVGFWDFLPQPFSFLPFCIRMKIAAATLNAKIGGRRADAMAGLKPPRPKYEEKGGTIWLTL